MWIVPAISFPRKESEPLSTHLQIVICAVYSILCLTRPRSPIYRVRHALFRGSAGVSPEAANAGDRCLLGSPGDCGEDNA